MQKNNTKIHESGKRENMKNLIKLVEKIDGEFAEFVKGNSNDGDRILSIEKLMVDLKKEVAKTINTLKYAKKLGGI